MIEWHPDCIELKFEVADPDAEQRSSQFDALEFAVKLALPDIPAMMQAMLRSIGALPVLLIVGWLRGANFSLRDGTLGPGILAGVLFGIEFALIYQGLRFTTACTDDDIARAYFSRSHIARSLRIIVLRSFNRTR